MKKNLLQPKNKLRTFLFLMFILFLSSCEESDAPSKNQNPDLKLKIKNTMKKAILKKDWETMRSNPDLFYRSNRFGPELRDGKIAGYKLYQLGKNGILSSLGFSSGDIIVQLNGYAMNDTEYVTKAASVKVIPWVVDVLRKEEYYRYEFIQIENIKDYKDEDIFNLELENHSYEVEKSKEANEKIEKEKKDFEEQNKNRIAPKNPQTDKPYSVEEMKQFKEIIKEMPDNLLIPKYMSQEEYLEKQKFDERLKEILLKIQAKTASKEEAETYFQHSELNIKGRIQITEYLLKSSKKEGENSNTIKNFENMILQSKQQLKVLKNQKKSYLKTLSNKK